MSESNMPAAEATGGSELDLMSYELAFHVLPTVAEGEVAAVFDRIKAAIVAAGGQITNEEAPLRFDLAYEIVKFLEGRNRKFGSAYFGWVRFTAEAAKIAEITEAVEGTKEILRHLLTRLTKTEEAHPFFFHPAIADRKVETIVIEEATEEVVDETIEETEAVVKDGEAEEETV
jgi:ribosomal protein S6